jgi:hypothetical protein
METLIAINPGMSSRFPKVMHFPDYTTEELCALGEAIVAGAGYQLTPAARAELRARLEHVDRSRGFGNGRVVRNLVEAAIDRQASRLAAAVREGSEPAPRALSQLRKADLTARLAAAHRRLDRLEPSSGGPTAGASRAAAQTTGEPS